ncbi:hypothetical protein HAP94_01555 [Acidithiobacillus ferrivorans]|nr:hypothetical protein [Acidithiobacillus ferrivorans]
MTLLVERVLFLPDRWLRRVDLGIALLSTVMVLHLTLSQSAIPINAVLIWSFTALTGFGLLVTNGTAIGLRKLRLAMPNILLLMALRFGLLF